MGHILLVEPDRPLAGIYEEALVQAGHTVSISQTAQDAIFAADDQTPDLVLLELQLTSHSGIEFLYEFRTYKEWEHVPVVISSHVPSHELRLSHNMLREQLGVTDYYYKPQMRLSDLLRLVDEALVAKRSPSG